MAYKLEHVRGDHIGVLMETMHKWSNNQPDMYIISEEGHKIYTHKLLVSFYSPILSTIISGGSNNEMPGVSVPESSSSLVNLLKVLATGIAISNQRADLQIVSKTAEVLGIQIVNWQIGVKNRGGVSKSKNEKADLKKPKKSVEKKPEIPIKPEVLDHPKDQEKKFSCDDCGKQFGRKDHLNRHALIHTGVNYPCQSCGSTFKRKEGLKQHMIKAHNTDPNEKDTSVNIKVEKGDKDIHDDDKDDESPVDEAMIEEAVFAQAAHLDVAMPEEEKIQDYESTEVDRFGNEAPIESGYVEDNITKISDDSSNQKLECSYCQEFVQDLADHWLEKHNDNDSLNDSI